jgi:pimeloyl-ACP methyl ester carboxylesterase
MRIRLSLIALALALPAAARGAPVFTQQACPAAAAQATVPITCGSVSVPENRKNPASRNINIAVIIAHTQIQPAARSPVVLAGGGPEGAIDADIAALRAPGAAALLANRDLIAFDYRGIGYSTPNLTCPANAQGQVNVPVCVAHLRNAGADLSGYTTRDVAADLHDIREALHLAPVNVWGTSYGSKVALTWDRYFPADIRSMILDGPNPLQTRESASLLVERTLAIYGLMAACAANPGCDTAFPRLTERFRAAIPRINAHPLTIDGSATTGDQLVLALWQAQTNIAALPLLPALMDQVARGTLTTLSSLGGATADNNAAAVAAQTLLACNASLYPPDRAGVAALLGTDPLITALVRQQDFAFVDICRSWPFKPLTSEDILPLTSRTPTLIFSGQYDPTLPLPEAQRAARTLSESRIVNFPGYAHVALGNGACPVAIAQQLFETLEPSKVDVSCTRSLAQPGWLTTPPAN